MLFCTQTALLHTAVEQRCGSETHTLLNSILGILLRHFALWSHASNAPYYTYLGLQSNASLESLHDQQSQIKSSTPTLATGPPPSTIQLLVMVLFC
jgi:hypothetical protein